MISIIIQWESVNTLVCPSIHLSIHTFIHLYPRLIFPNCLTGAPASPFKAPAALEKGLAKLLRTEEFQELQSTPGQPLGTASRLRVFSQLQPHACQPLGDSSQPPRSSSQASGAQARHWEARANLWSFSQARGGLSQVLKSVSQAFIHSFISL